jgi:hypothetical protein
MDAKPIDLGKVLSQLSANEKRSQRRSVIYTVVSLLIGGIWLSYSIIQVSNLRKEVSGLTQAKAELDKEIEEKKIENERLGELKRTLLREWGWTDKTIGNDETIGKEEETLEANNQRQAIASTTDTPANLERRKNITIEYFPKDFDKDSVRAALRGLGFTTLIRESPGTTPTNSVWFGRSVHVDDVKLVAFTLIRAGVEIRDIRPYLDSGGRESLIQLGGRPLAVNKPVWTVERISAAKDFPRE